MVIDVREDNDTFRFADGTSHENIVHYQKEYNIAVISGEDGEAEVAVRDIDNLVEALRQIQKRAKKDDDVTVNIVNNSAGDVIKSGVFDEKFQKYFGIDRAKKGEDYTGRYVPGVTSVVGFSDCFFEPIPVEAQRFFSDWIKHDGSNKCPIHPLDKIRLSTTGEGNRAGVFIWWVVEYYQHVKDEDGVPYVYGEGLEPWAEYVATDEDGSVCQYASKPGLYEDDWYSSPCHTAPNQYRNTIDHWTETLRRVFRKEDDGGVYRG